MFSKTAIFALAAACSIVTAATALASETKPHVDTSGVNMQPNYPASALLARERGSVLLDVVVEENGSVSKIMLHRSSGFDDLDSAAIAAVMNWRFTPAMENNVPREGVTTLAIAFGPPDAASDSSGDRVSSLSPQIDYLPQQLKLEAPVGANSEQTRSIPCDNGTLSVSAKMLDLAKDFRGPSVRAQDYQSSLWISVDSGSEKVVSRAFLIKFDNVWVQNFSVERWSANDQTESQSFMAKINYGESVILDLSWNALGIVTSNVGIETKNMKLSSRPTKLSFGVSGLKAGFEKSVLICTPPLAKGN